MVSVHVAAQLHPSWSVHGLLHPIRDPFTPSVHVPLGQCPLAHSSGAATLQDCPVFVFPHVAPFDVSALLQVPGHVHPSTSVQVMAQAFRAVLAWSVAEHFPSTQNPSAQSEAKVQIFPTLHLNEQSAPPQSTSVSSWFLIKSLHVALFPPQVCEFVIGPALLHVVRHVHPSWSAQVTVQDASDVLAWSVGLHRPFTQNPLEQA